MGLGQVGNTEQDGRVADHPLMIHVSAVSKSYGSGASKSNGASANQSAPPVLREISLDVPGGEFVTLMGASGSGKTTLLNLIGGLDTPDSGLIKVGGQDLRLLTDTQRSAFRLRHIGFVFQFFNLLPHLSVLENIALPLLFLDRKESAANGAAAALAEEVGLGDKLQRRMHQLSGGEMQRVALARALVHQPMALLADEPTGNLDSKTGLVILDLIRAAASRHRATVLMATHDAQAARLADRVVHMRDGQLVEP
jgi:putative ABC transport system ATP-binding protein